MDVLFFILGLVLIVVAAIVCKTVEMHELHKMRAVFEDRRHSIECLIKQSPDDKDYYLGELHILEELEDLIDKELENLEEL